MFKIIMDSWNDYLNYHWMSLVGFGLFFLSIGILILLVPEILVLFIASVFLFIGILLLYIGWKLKKAQQEINHIKIDYFD